MSTHSLCFEQKYENISFFFLSEYFQFLEVKFSIYLNRHVFVIKRPSKFRCSLNAAFSLRDTRRQFLPAKYFKSTCYVSLKRVIPILHVKLLKRWQKTNLIHSVLWDKLYKITNEISAVIVDNRICQQAIESIRMEKKKKKKKKKNSCVFGLSVYDLRKVTQQ